jgi:hypothetical protein
MTASYATVGSGDHHVLAVHSWFGSAHGWGRCPSTWTGTTSPTDRSHMRNGTGVGSQASDVTRQMPPWQTFGRD